MAKASNLSKEFQSIVDKIGSDNITIETREEISVFSEKFQSYVDTHDGNFSKESATLQSVKDMISSSNLTKEKRIELQEVQREIQSKIDKSK